MLLELQDVRKEYPQRSEILVVLRDVNLCVAAGEFVAIVGPSGSGKSTLLQILGGLEEPTSGDVLCSGRSIVGADDETLSRHRRTAVGFVFQHYELLEELTATENVLVPLLLNHLAGPDADAHARQCLEQVQLADRADHYPEQLSGGERQRVALARALATQPAVILADEPTGNLDRRSGEQVMDLLAATVRAGGPSVVMATHDPAAAARADRILELADGCLRPGSLT